MTKNNNLLISVLVVVVFVAGIFLWSGGEDAVVEDSVVPTEDTSTGSTNAPKTTKKTNTATTPTISYPEALVAYADRRIQLDDDCSAVPFNVTYKTGTEIMLDNRSAFDRTIGIAGAKYPLKAYGFKIVKISATTIPSTVYMSCDSLDNVVTILVQE